MKTSKKKSRTGKKTPAKRESRGKTGRPSIRRISSSENPVTASSAIRNLNTCEEVEVGDIGGFGSTEELESHEIHCTQPVSQICTACGRKLCKTHYELLHRDHNPENRQPKTLGLA